jgi:hypothetical protein
MKYIPGNLLALILGAFIGFFGVFNSVFSDSSGLKSKLIIILVILLIYSILSALLGYFFPKSSWMSGFYLSLSGMIFLLLYMLREYNPFYFLYIILLVTLSCLSSYWGSRVR